MRHKTHMHQGRNRPVSQHASAKRCTDDTNVFAIRAIRAALGERAPHKQRTRLRSAPARSSGAHTGQISLAELSCNPYDSFSF